MQQILSVKSRVLALLLLICLVGVLTVVASERPTLALTDSVQVRPDKVARVAVTFVGGDDTVTAVVFSVDYDETLLTYVESDGVECLLGEGFACTVAFSAADTDSELDITLRSDDGVTNIPDEASLLIPLRAALEVPDGTVAAVNFSQSPAPSYGNSLGRSIPGALVTNGTVVITSEAINLAPVAVNDLVRLDAPGEIDVLANDFDPDNDSLSITALTDPLFGEAFINNDVVFYAPPDDFAGADSFRYTLSDGTNEVMGSVLVGVKADILELNPDDDETIGEIDEDNPAAVYVFDLMEHYIATFDVLEGTSANLTWRLQPIGSDQVLFDTPMSDQQLFLWAGTYQLIITPNSVNNSTAYAFDLLLQDVPDLAWLTPTTSQISIDLAWSLGSVANATQTLLEVSADGGFNWGTLADLTISQTTYTMLDLSCSNTFRVRARAYTGSIDEVHAASDVLTVSTEECAPNDSIADALLIDTLAYTHIVDTTSATTTDTDPLPACGANPGHSVWYQLIMTEETVYEFSTSGSAFDTALSVWIWDSEAGLQPVACDDDGAPGATSFLRVTLQSDKTYYALVTGNNDESGIVNLSVEGEIVVEPLPPTATPLPTATALPVPDGVALFDPATGDWRFRASDGVAGIYFRFGNGLNGQPLVGDWNGDGSDGVGVYSNGIFLLREVSNSGSVDRRFTFGPVGDNMLAVAGDWNGDGIDGIGVFDGRTWWLRETADSGPTQIRFQFGLPSGGGIPLTGDWLGQAFDTVGIYEQGLFILRRDNTTDAGSIRLRFGSETAAWAPVAGDWNQDGIDTVGLFKEGAWRLLNDLANPRTSLSFAYGNSGIPLANYRGGVAALEALAQPPIVVPTATVMPTLVVEETQIVSPTATSIIPETTEDIPEATQTVLPPTATLMPSATSQTEITALPTEPPAEVTESTTP